MTLCLSNDVSFSTIRQFHSDVRHEDEEERRAFTSNTTSDRRQAEQGSMLVRMAMRVSRAKWFTFLRRIFHYQNGSNSPLGPNPFNSSSWMIMEFLTLVSQICVTLIVLSVSKAERPVWPMRLWVIGYDLGCVMSLLMLYWRYVHYHIRQRENGISLNNLEQQCTTDDSRNLELVSKCKASLDLFFAMWFVVGNVWVFDTRFGSFNGAPKLNILCILILVWNAITYSFPFLLFILLCIFVPLISGLIGYNMSLGSAEKGASHDQISKLICWRFKDVDGGLEGGNSSFAIDNPDCCICLTKYKEKEEIRQLPCSHIFHKNCVDQWLGMISCCPLCKQGLER
ncbi:E3 ubiquitin-protein ligase At1g63170-like [Silene latifolia]|uniref:E3 ubiquitin-protein ligase At1g63170-like n=1 Tax=Silene latifolia TaxID=37657 RepID=UPI003D777FD5